MHRGFSLLLLLASLGSPLLAQSQPAQPPIISTPNVPLVVPQLNLPLPAEAVPQQSPNQALWEFRDGVMRIKIAGVALPIGACCFCPDGSEKPAQWKAANSSTEKR